MKLLKVSTQVVKLIGPFLDKTDGVTEETGLAGAGTEISKEGAAFGAGPVLGTHDSDGWYPITLTTTHTNTLGELAIKVHDAATHLPVWERFTVVPANIWDALVGGTVSQKVDVETIKTQAVTCGAAVTVRADVGAAAAPGAANGMLIGGSNAATTFAGLTTGALSCTTITASGAVAFQSTFAVTTSTSLAALSATTVTFSGAVAFQSTFAVTTSTSLGALSCTTLTASGAVAFQSTFAVTTSTSLAALSATTFATSGTTTFNAFTITNALTVSGATTLTGAVTGTNASNNLHVNVVKVDSAGLASHVAGMFPADILAIDSNAGVVAGLGTFAGEYQGGTLTTTINGDINGSVSGNVGGKILGGGAGVISAVGAWALNGAGAALATATAVDDLPTNAELATALGTADDAVLAQVALVKAQTDRMTFTVANQIDANIQYVNDTQVKGVGTLADPWNPV